MQQAKVVEGALFEEQIDRVVDRMWYVYTRGARWILAYHRASSAMSGVDAMDYGELPLKTERFESYRRFVVTHRTLPMSQIRLKEGATRALI